MTPIPISRFIHPVIFLKSYCFRTMVIVSVLVDGNHKSPQWFQYFMFPRAGVAKGHKLSELQKQIYSLKILFFSHSVMSDSLWPHGLQHARLPCPSPYLRAYSDSCPLSEWCHPTISCSVDPFSCLQSFPASMSFPVNLLFASGGQSVDASASASFQWIFRTDFL